MDALQPYSEERFHARLRNRFAVPEPLVPPFMRETLAFIGLRVRTRRLRFGLVELPMAVISAKEKEALSIGISAFKTVFKEGLGPQDTMSQGGIPAFLPQSGAVIMHRVSPVPKETTERLGEEQVLDAYGRVLRNFAALAGGIAVHFHHGYELDFAAPSPAGPDEVRFHTSCRPPGEAYPVYRGTAFGFPLRKTQEQVFVHAPAKGRGVEILDADGNPVIQIVARNAYFLTPVISVFASADTRYLETLLTHAWKHIDAQPRARGRTPSAKTLAKAGAIWLDETVGNLDALVRRQNEEIARLNVKLNDAYSSKMQYMLLRESFGDSASIRKRRDGIRKEFLKIHRMEKVAAAEIVDGGLHVYTRDLVVEHEGACYRIGSYVIRVGKGNRVSVWSEASLHPEGIDHPHISRSGAECFGNATSAIQRFSQEFRYAELVGLVIRWLERGYTPALAEYKITDWPLAPNEESAVQRGGNRDVE